jgi:thiol-disulfide isomerase/thioredoxin
VARRIKAMIGLLAIVGVACTFTAPASVAQTCPTSLGQSCPAPGRSPTVDPTSLIGSKPPATSGKNLNGKGTLTLASLLGRPTAVVFWLNTCPHCRTALRQANRLRSSLGSDKQLVTAAINAELKGPKGFATPAAATKTLHLQVPTILVAQRVARNQWHVGATPTTFIIDSNGVITQVIQPEDAGSLAGEIQSALAQTV